MKALLIHASVPALYLGGYGNEAVETSGLDRLAASGVVFDAHETDGGSAAHFLRTLTAGRHAFAAGPDDPPILLARLKQAGAATLLFSTRQAGAADEWTHAECLPGESHDTPIVEGIAALLDHLVEYPDWLFVLDLGRLAPGEWPAVEEDTEATESSEEVDEAEPIEGGNLEADSADDQEETEPEEEADEPALVIEDEEEPLEPEVQALLEGQAAVAADVEEFDVFFQWLMGEIQERNLAEELLVVFTGQSLAEVPDGLCSAGPAHPLRQSVSRLPLIAHLPESRHGGRRISALTQPADLMNTLLAWFGLPTDSGHGQSLIPLWEGQKQLIRGYACAQVGEDENRAQSLTSPEWRFLSQADSSGDLRRWLFRLPEDRFGFLDMYQQKLDFAERLEACLQGFLAASKQSGPLIAPELPPEIMNDQIAATERSEE